MISVNSRQKVFTMLISLFSIGLGVFIKCWENKIQKWLLIQMIWYKFLNIFGGCYSNSMTKIYYYNHTIKDNVDQKNESTFKKWQKEITVYRICFMYMYMIVYLFSLGYHIQTARVEKKYSNTQSWAKVGLQLLIWKKTCRP